MLLHCSDSVFISNTCPMKVTLKKKRKRTEQTEQRHRLGFFSLLLKNIFIETGQGYDSSKGKKELFGLTQTEQHRSKTLPFVNSSMDWTPLEAGEELSLEACNRCSQNVLE